MPLTEKRKADREQMLTQILAIAEQHGASVEVDRPDARTIMLHLKGPRGLGAHIELSGGSPQPDVHVIPWHLACIACISGEKLSVAFDADVNPHHYCKSTQVAYGTDALLANITRALCMAGDGSAFQ